MAYPISLNLSGRKCVVVGAGKVGERKIRGLIEAQARVFVIGIAASPQVQSWAQQGQITFARRAFAVEDVAGAFLVFAATDDRKVNAHVVNTARARNILVCHSGGGESDFTLPAVLNRGDLQLSVSSAGTSPRYAAMLRDWLAKHIPVEHADIVVLLGRLRDELKKQFPDDSAKRQEILRTLVNQTMMEAVQNGNIDQVKQRILECLSLSRD